MKINNKIAISDIRMMGLDMINNASSGHPGIVLGAAPILYTLFTYHLKYKIGNPNYLDRDYFIMSSGHGSALLYSTLFYFGYDYEIEDLEKFRKINSKTPGHPEYNPSLGIEMTTGPLGQGISSSVGLAMAQKYLNKVDSNKHYNNYVYALCGDGDLMEGISYEAISLAGNLKLNNLIFLYDSNNITLDGSTNLSFVENVVNRFISLGWDVIIVNDGDNVRELNSAISRAKDSDLPCLIKINTIIGKYSKNENTSLVHGSPLDKEDLESIRSKLTTNKVPFSYNQDNRRLHLKYVNDRMNKYNDFNVNNVNTEIDFSEVFNLINDKMNMREINGIVMNVIAKYNKYFLGGSADTVSSVKTNIYNSPMFDSKHYMGRNIYYGVREHAMGAITNGLVLGGLRAFSSTFLTFSNYMLPAIREAALMNIPSIFIFTHDSITIGEDGPTHQPIEQLNQLRLIPNLDVYRPCDTYELISCWKEILRNSRPSCLILSRNKTDLVNSDNVDVKNGAYIVLKEEKKLDFVIMATGSEVGLAISIVKELDNPHIRVISVPNLNRFNELDDKVRESILPNNVLTYVIEYGNDALWYRYAKRENIFGINTFGKSGKKEDVIKYFKLDSKNIISKMSHE